jgi:isoamylase
MHISAIDRGATLYEDGVSFSLVAPQASLVELCLYKNGAAPDSPTNVPLSRDANGKWCVFIAHVEAGQEYGYRVHGDWDPHSHKYFNPAKVLVDPYACAVDRSMRHYNSSRFIIGQYKGGEFVRSLDDNADVTPRSVVVDNSLFHWGASKAPAIAPANRVIIELHPKSATMLLDAVPADVRGTYLGLAHPAFLGKILGKATSIQLVLNAAASEPFLLQKGLENFWGYNPVCSFLAPDPAYAHAKTPQGVVDEIKHVVKTYHDLGMEVLIDVVFNHTAEGGNPQSSPTFGYRAMDSRHYKRSGNGVALDLTGCGNTLDMDFKENRQIVLDALLYWRNVMKVDGFRFDLATVLGAVDDHYEYNAPFFRDLRKHDIRIINTIAEPWGGFGYWSGYQLGNVPMQYEWNGEYRDRMRQFWGGLTNGASQAGINDFSKMFTGSAYLFQGKPGKNGSASVNFIDAHDGFTLMDIVSYNQKHNSANLENNRDGHDHNCSWNGGIEGKTSDPLINEFRFRRARALMASLMISQGTAMYSLGDLVLNTQYGNNNAYCQDSTVSWIKWKDDPSRGSFGQFVEDLFELRQAEPLLARNSFDGSEARISWHRADGHLMNDNEWHQDWVKNINILLTSPSGISKSEHGLYIAVNSSFYPVSLRLPYVPNAEFKAVCNTAEATAFAVNASYNSLGEVTLSPVSIMIFRVKEQGQ